MSNTLRHPTLSHVAKRVEFNIYSPYTPVRISYVDVSLQQTTQILQMLKLLAQDARQCSKETIRLFISIIIASHDTDRSS